VCTVENIETRLYKHCVAPTTSTSGSSGSNLEAPFRIGIVKSRNSALKKLGVNQEARKVLMPTNGALEHAIRAN
jgi:hypothetical protein